MRRRIVEERRKEHRKGRRKCEITRERRKDEDEKLRNDAEEGERGRKSMRE